MLPTRLPILGLALACTATQIPAQHPTPSGESDQTVWSNHEVSTLEHMRRLYRASRRGRKLPLRLPPGGMLWGDYRIVCFERGRDDAVEETSSGDGSGDTFLLGWPEHRSEEARRGLLLHPDGMTLFCELGERRRAPIAPDLVLGRGGKDTFDDVLRQPGTSTSGHFWLWLDQAVSTVGITVVDENDEPRRDCRVALTANAASPAGTTLLPDGPWPAGSARLDAEGHALVRGPRARDLAITVTLPDGLRVASGLAVRATTAGLRCVLNSAAIHRARVLPTELRAIAALRDIFSAQKQFRASGRIDADGDGTGEFGFFGELAGTSPLRGRDPDKPLPPVLSRGLGKVAESRVRWQGYVFQIWLPGPRGRPIPEAPTGGGRSENGRELPVDADLAEQCFALYAWPLSTDTGQRTFFVGATGDVLATDDGAMPYAGERAPRPLAAFPAGTRALGRRAPTAGQGVDGSRWQIVK